MRFLLPLCTLVALVLAAALAQTSDAAVGPAQQAGDADCSGTTTAADALTDLQYIATPNTKGCAGAGNVICDDNIDLADVVAILRYSAGLPTTIDAPCLQVGAPLDGMIISQGTMTIKGTFSADLDQISDGAPPDVFWNQISETERKLLPENNARFALISGQSFNALSFAYLYSRVYSSDAINGNNDATNGLNAGALFAVQTSDGNYAKVKVVDYGYNLQIQWVTYRPSSS
ncbi:MAG: hypothetical protein ABI559_09050 [Chloroflexota bacterium]